MMRWRSRATLALAFAMPVLASFAAYAQQQKPNFVIIWGDDIGQSNVSAYTNGLMGYRTPSLPLFTQGLAETGYIVGRNVTIELREGDLDQMPALAADLVRRHVMVIVAVGLRVAQAAKAATQTIPVVFGIAPDPVEFGLVASLNRPSGNLTGVYSTGVELAGKRLELLHKLVPVADPIALLTRTDGPGSQAETRAMQSAADVLGVRLLALHALPKARLPRLLRPSSSSMPVHL
jgi:putative ABC transport system substrate-binding protein